INVFCVMFALMVGTAGLPHVIVRFYTTKTVRAARWSAGWALLFIAALYTTAPAIAVFAKHNLLESLDGAKIELVEGPQVRASGEIDPTSRTVYSLTPPDGKKY